MMRQCLSLTPVDNLVNLHNENVQPNTNCMHTHSKQHTEDPTYGKQARRILCTFRAQPLHNTSQWGRQKRQCMWKLAVVFLHVDVY